jgi:hypothetical protein
VSKLFSFVKCITDGKSSEMSNALIRYCNLYMNQLRNNLETELEIP